MMRFSESAAGILKNVAEDSSDPEISRGELPEGFHGSAGGGKSWSIDVDWVDQLMLPWGGDLKMKLA